MLLGVHLDRKGREGVPWSVNPSLGEIIPRWKHGTFCVQDGTLEPNLRGPERDRRQGRGLTLGHKDQLGRHRLSGWCRKISVGSRRWQRPGKPNSFQARGDPGMSGTMCGTAEAIVGVRVSTGVSTRLSAGPASSIHIGRGAWMPEARTGHDLGQPGRSV